MNPKIKRRLKVYNNRYNKIGFEMKIDQFDGLTFITLNYQIDPSTSGTMVIGLFRRDNKYFIRFYEEVFALETAAIISDFLYYGMAILEDLKGEK